MYGELMKKIIFSIFLILFLIGSINAVFSANSTDEIIGDTDDDIDLSNVNNEIPLEKGNSNDDILSYSDDDLSKESQDYSILSAVSESSDSTNSSENNFIIVNKNWEGNYSGSIEEIQIQLLKKIIKDPLTPPKWKASPLDISDNYGANYENLDLTTDSVGDIVILPDENGVLTSYTIVQTVKITKADGWKYVFKNITFVSASLNSTNQWSLDDSTEYIIREINLLANVQIISSSFVKYFTSPEDGGLKVIWNLTNMIIPNETTNNTENETNNKTDNETTNNIENETNNTTEDFNETEEFNLTEPVSEYGKGSESLKNTTSESSSGEKQNFDVSKSATGNPIFIILVAIFSMFISVLRRKL